MNNNILVSVIVPIYNQEKYLDNSISALMNQTYSNIEIILVNDGSTDSSLNIINKYQLIDSRIVVIDKSNGGLVDATITGIRNATGNYIAFLDPDDYVGDNFIENFISELDDEYDFVAEGFYSDYSGRLVPYILTENTVYKEDDIKKLKENFLISETSADIPHNIFVARWNKIYKKNCILKMIDEFDDCKDISLGEDSIFTYLMLSNSSLGKTIKACNSYYYNLGNQNSMMKSEAIEKHFDKANKAFKKFSEILFKKGDCDKQAYILYYHLIDSIFKRNLNADKKEFKKIYKRTKKDDAFKKSLSICLDVTKNYRRKIPYILKKILPNSTSYYFVTVSLKKNLKKIKTILDDMHFIIVKLRKNSIVKSFRLLKYRKDRRNAFRELNEKIPLLQDRIEPILKKYEGLKTNFEDCPICKNVFVFWWDGFDGAPSIVKTCLESVKKFHNDSKVIEITKDTFKDYTDIHPIILNDFKAGKISVQTFSDILRFNLLKNNGGTWIDATIFFTKKYDLSEGLKTKAFESVEFATSKDFFKYQDTYCSWSGYFISSRKNSVFVTAVNEVFEQYYLKYRTYTTYFFIDATLMICKINKLDNDALNHISYNSGDMFVLGRLLYEEYSPYYLETVEKVPQKLQWGFKYCADENTNYKQILMKDYR